MAKYLTDEELQKLYAWIDTIPLSRPKRNINRDFSDGVLAAEVVAYYFPRLVDLHNYSAANGLQQKFYNWNTFNIKVLTRLKYQLSPPAIEDIIHSRAGAVEVFLHSLQAKLAKYKAARPRSSSTSTACSPEDDHLANDPNLTTTSSTFISDGAGGPTLKSSLRKILTFHDAAASPPSVPSPSRAPGSDSSAAAGRDVGQQRSMESTGSNGLAQTAAERHPTGSERTGGDSYNVGAGQAGRKTRNLAQTVRTELHHEVDQEILLEKEERIQELRETVEIQEMKMSKMEQLLRLKEAKIQRLLEELVRVQSAGRKPDPIQVGAAGH